MGIWKNEDILAYQVGQELVCCDCMEKNDWDGLKEEDLYAEKDFEDPTAFCGRCKENIA